MVLIHFLQNHFERFVPRSIAFLHLKFTKIRHCYFFLEILQLEKENAFSYEFSSLQLNLRTKEINDNFEEELQRIESQMHTLLEEKAKYELKITGKKAKK